MLFPIISIPQSKAPENEKLLKSLSILPFSIYTNTQNEKQVEFTEGSCLIYSQAPEFGDLVSDLDGGLDIAYLPYSHFASFAEDLVQYKIPSSRIGVVVANVDELSAALSCSEVLELSGYIFVESVPDLCQLDNLAENIQSYVAPNSKRVWRRRVIVNISQPLIAIDTFDSFAQKLASLKADIALSSDLISLDGRGSGVSLSKAFISATGLSSDREDGLFTTIVQNQAGVCLGVAYSSAESLANALSFCQGVYWSRKRGLWHKGLTSGATQNLLKINVDCDADTLQFIVEQTEPGFCHNNTLTCFDTINSCSTGMLSRLCSTLSSRLSTAPEGSYTQRLFKDTELLNDKILEEAHELCEAQEKKDVAWEAADILYFLLVKCTAHGVSLRDIENNLALKHKKISRRPGNSKNPKLNKPDTADSTAAPSQTTVSSLRTSLDKVSFPGPNDPILMRSFDSKDLSKDEMHELFKRPIINSDQIIKTVKPIIDQVKANGDEAIRQFTLKFDNVSISDVVIRPPFVVPPLPDSVKSAIDVAYDNITKFHKAQLSDTLTVETMPGVVCSRFSRPIERVGLYVPGGTAVLPSTALMLGVPAQVAGCREIVVASPPDKSGNLAAEVMYVASKLNATAIVKAGGAQAVAALAYGTETVPKVDKICGPGNQFVTAAKMLVQNDVSAMVSIDMPAGPSELLVIADSTSEPSFIASDLLSQAEHGVDSQVVLLTVGMDQKFVDVVQHQVDTQAKRLPRVDIVRKSIPKSYILNFDTLKEAMDFSNQYAPEHLILQIENAQECTSMVNNAGSVFVGKYSPESCGDYASGTNHTLPTYGFSKMYSGVNISTFQKHITSQMLTKEGLELVGPSVMTLAEVEGLEAHRNAVAIRFAKTE
ncbi:hypothetical protein BB560_000595 [Smittium megazygosporum]|uniref:Histidine biosynthesis trifunctional protein n=1 Tax=Smittium megazygosporum TaxID=133381 RepID=A0A2T9ZJT7_9FUNG|nr:hypothetical protein BB560_000595 [Smittium megazygosporum]